MPSRPLRTAALAAAALVALAAIAYFSGRQPPAASRSSAPEPEPVAAAVSFTAANSSPPTPPARTQFAAPTTPPAPPANPPPATQLPPAVPAIPGRDVTLDNVQFALRDFRNAVGSNPVGTNAEITRALLGDNPKQLRLPLPDGTGVNAAGELCDEWGTPLFFHQLSGADMEVRSAGPDRTMWTSDDRQRR
jgi:hypothetical protein